ncbi:MAG TPA: AzlD domain-containing protein [Rhodoferax sp.]|nr:AzlD domain-containing protein [Rhodoferax sp.]HQY75195.1 AzlD domain-containing protein [Rhodoferax sp.]
MSPTDGWTLGVLVGMGVVTVVTRCFFFISNRSWQLPHWAQRGLQYAPIAALSAVVLPEVVMTQGQLITTWQDARLFAAVAGAAYFFVRKGQGQAVLGTIVSGMVVYLPLHIGLGW